MNEQRTKILSSEQQLSKKNEAFSQLEKEKKGLEGRMSSLQDKLAQTKSSHKDKDKQIDSLRAQIKNLVAGVFRGLGVDRTKGDDFSEITGGSNSSSRVAEFVRREVDAKLGALVTEKDKALVTLEKTQNLFKKLEEVAQKKTDNIQEMSEKFEDAELLLTDAMGKLRKRDETIRELKASKFKRGPGRPLSIKKVEAKLKAEVDKSGKLSEKLEAAEFERDRVKNDLELLMFDYQDLERSMVQMRTIAEANIEIEKELVEAVPEREQQQQQQDEEDAEIAERALCAICSQYEPPPEAAAAASEDVDTVDMTGCDLCGNFFHGGCVDAATGLNCQGAAVTCELIGIQCKAP